MNIIKLFAKHRADKNSDKYAYLAVMQEMADEIKKLKTKIHELTTSDE